MYPQDITSSLVQPSHNDNVVADRETVKALSHQRIHFKPCVGRPLRALFGRLAALLDARSDQTDRLKLSATIVPRCSHDSPSFLLGLHRSLSDHAYPSIS